ncbi:toprim domain-containing protein [Photobacterium leiognathi]|uniref:toprim domain-containing protein n=1 Tax=Photobacterium leiognathi TaxID=553611 RepID=UPI0029811F25|nr:toprim domain-containing protein [Photobacterium leiognathi]
MSTNQSTTSKYADSYKSNRLDQIKQETQEITAMVSGRWHEILSDLYPVIADAANSHTAGKQSVKKSFCPKHGGKSGEAFRFLKGGAEYGSCVCHSCGVWKNGFSMIMDLDNCNFREAVKKVGYLCGYYTDDNGTVAQGIQDEVAKRQAEYIERKRIQEAEQKVKDERDNKRGLERLCAMWKGSVSLDHPFATPARLYFEKRGLGNIGTLNDEVRLHPALEFFVKVTKKGYKGRSMVLAGKFPCLLSQIRTPEGKPVRIHRTYLDFDGNKLDLSKVQNNLVNLGLTLNDVDEVEAKKMTPQVPLTDITGASIQLCEAGTKIIGVGEGLETTLAASVATGMPVNCCINATMLASWLPAQGTEYVFIFKDKDVSKTGEIKADELRERLEPYGIKVFDFEPEQDIPEGEKGIDWADVFKAEGVLGFPMEARNWRSLL